LTELLSDCASAGQSITGQRFERSSQAARGNGENDDSVNQHFAHKGIDIELRQSIAEHAKNQDANAGERRSRL
jgi:hypothetical protein